MGILLLILCGIIVGGLSLLFIKLVRSEKRVKLLRGSIILFSLVALTILLYVSFASNSSLYTVEARTEYLEYVSTEKKGKLNLTNVRFSENESPVVDSVNCSVELLPGVEVHIFRIAEGPLQIYLSLPKGLGALGVMEYDEGGSDSLFNAVAFELSNPKAALMAGKSHLIYFEGRDLAVGKNVAKPTSSTSGAVLHEGVVTANEQVLIGRARYESIRYDLGYGETLYFDTEQHKGKARSGLGFAVLDGNPGLKVVYNINAQNARVGKAGLDETDKHLIIRPSMLSRL